LIEVVGSSDLIGNPVGLFNNVSSGVEDFFYEPYKGLRRGIKFFLFSLSFFSFFEVSK